MPSIEHLALWTSRIDELAAFYCRWFGATKAPSYRNEAKRFSSVFLSFQDGARLELMCRDGMTGPSSDAEHVGLAHFAVSLGTEDAVRRQTDAMRAAGVAILGEPRRTGDGYFESVVADPDGNRIELTV